MRYHNNQGIRHWAIIRDALAACTLLVLLGMFGCPTYNVWRAELTGEAELARATANRQIAIREAEAKLQSAKLLADAEVERAKGVARANEIVADGLKGREEYLRYLWIDKLSASAGREVIYIPTEAGMPILEAGRSGRAPELTPRSADPVP
jgi:hypothetical protein